MESNGIKRVPVVHDGKIVGIVSRADLLQVLASGGAPKDAEDSDRLVRERLLAELGKQQWASPSEIEYRGLGRGRAYLGHRRI